MIKNYLKLTLRNIRRQPVYTFLNILGLTIGVTSTLFILLFLKHETRYDQYHEKADQIYRISSDISEKDDHFRWASSQLPLGMELKNNYSEVEEYVRLIANGRTRLEYEDKFYFEENTFIVDSTIFDVFTFDLIEGDYETALKEPNTTVLSDKVAEKLFGKERALDKLVETPSGRTYKVTGVYKEMPKHSSFIIDVMFSANTFPNFMNPDPRSWGGFRLFTYVLLQKGTDPIAFESKLPEVIKDHVEPIFEQAGVTIKYELIALNDIHLKSTFEGEAEPTGQVGFLYVFGVVAFLMLLIACINYMNLATARATQRGKEVGVRKVLGSSRQQLMLQFLSESVLFTLFAMFLSFALVNALLPLFNETFGLQLTNDLIGNPTVLLAMFGVLFLVGVIGGSYPAFFLSAFEPIKVLKGSLSTDGGNQRLRKVLIGIQFGITMFMIIGTGVIYDQMNYLSEKNLGFEKENVMKIDVPRSLAEEKNPILFTQLLENPNILEIGSASNSPGGGVGKNLLDVELEEGRMEEYGIDLYGVDYNYFSSLGIKIVNGRNFDPDRSTDSTEAIIINESMVKRFGWKDPIGKKFRDSGGRDSSVFYVVGIVKDFHQQSLYNPITPLAFFPQFGNTNVHVKLKVDDGTELSSLIAFTENTWNTIFPNNPFEYEFVDENFMELYEADQIRARIFTLFSILMIAVACLGLLGLSSFIAEQRKKELGIRKILGAETRDIVYLLTKNFLVLVLLAALPAFICAWYFMSQWLGTFAYQTQMKFWIYGVALFLVILVALLTTGYHALKAATSNPIKSIRYE